jgi:hypothetical protein
VDAGGKSLISICFSKIAGAPIGSLKFLGSKVESMACALRRYEVTDSGIIKPESNPTGESKPLSAEPLSLQESRRFSFRGFINGKQNITADNSVKSAEPHK